MGHAPRHNVKQWRLLDEGLAAKRRDNPIAVLQEVQDDAKSVRFIRLPRIVTYETQKHPSHAKGDEPRARCRARHPENQTIPRR